MERLSSEALCSEMEEEEARALALRAAWERNRVLRVHRFLAVEARI